MSASVESQDPHHHGIDIERYQPSDDFQQLILRKTGLQGEALKQHVLAVQAKAWSVYQYPCITRYSFLDFNAASHPAYAGALEQGKKDAIYVELGCFFGTDSRKLVADGYPPDRILGVDLYQAFLDLGYELYKDNPDDKDTPAFLAGDIFKILLPPVGMFLTQKPSNLHSLTSLNGLRSNTGCVSCFAFFHLFDLATQKKLATLILHLLNKQSGSVLFGGQRGLKEGQEDDEPVKKRHSAESFKALWIEVLGDRSEQYDIQSELVPRKRAWNRNEGWLLWSVRRL